MDYRQRTLSRETGCTGIGLHSGEKIHLNLRPAPPNTGIRFVRTDVDGHPMIEAGFENVVDTTLATTIGFNGCTVSTVEHLMAALFGLGIDNAVVEVDGPEVPIMDGSAAPFVFLIQGAGIQEQREPKRFIVIRRRFELKDGDRSVCIQPSKELKITYTIDFPHPLLKNQTYELGFSGKDFVREISKARTFGFLKDIETLKENGLARGGSLDNAIVLDDFRILNEDGLRYRDEFVKHKILDFLGDLSIIGAPVIGHFIVKKSGHFLNQYMLKKLVREKKCWQELVFETPEACCETNVNIPAFGTLEAAVG
ncbi:MAG: UDP-3-O-acyl-N-acetylglucosamine deacetylase [Deltaproteobacteria bacterium]|nr:UDP-3-O-acyl-N-acetylglucosamine deacetylase [Deltaproteobacteria bacterium]MBW1923291.1 UDP-3-O-acyl-N-acetylglucosamine deacetylase [Deltaproteobacteria bacterium]MBW1950986.1 UDP-3-O-acyl-N-acetylglucosamine deacetylase [Deltaproteobacteria bacterium]MBW2009302.1 UDP-3-O-acyl-N-acetylglucosamine deacetylase [Deltaproteobacteria bacterium]MBW2103320.1 UDP-3-O-acyl-N-acetylglucosamine deacetylase [Deltaproteobacteria bacterium]